MYQFEVDEHNNVYKAVKIIGYKRKVYYPKKETFQKMGIWIDENDSFIPADKLSKQMAYSIFKL